LATPWDGRYFANLGEVIGDTSVTVVIPNTAFHLMPPEGIRALTKEQISVEIGNLPDGTLFPHIAIPPNGTALPLHVTQFRTRHSMFLPAKYVPLVLSTKGYTLKGVWDILTTAFQQDNVLDELEPIVDWLRAALTDSGTGVPSVGVALIAPPMDMDLYEHRSELICRLLPGLGNQTQQMLSPAIY
jgi:hypothetical protein